MLAKCMLSVVNLSSAPEHVSLQLHAHSAKYIIARTANTSHENKCTSVYPRICPKSISFLEHVFLWLNSWPIQKKLGIKGFFSVSDETEASRYRGAKQSSR